MVFGPVWSVEGTLLRTRVHECPLLDFGWTFMQRLLYAKPQQRTTFHAFNSGGRCWCNCQRPYSAAVAPDASIIAGLYMQIKALKSKLTRYAR